MTETDSAEQEERSVETLIDDRIPYGEMSETELESVIEYKAGLKARDAAYTAALDAIEQNLSALADVHASIADKGETMIDSIMEAWNEQTKQKA